MRLSLVNLELYWGFNYRFEGLKCTVNKKQRCFRKSILKVVRPHDQLKGLLISHQPYYLDISTCF